MLCVHVDDVVKGGVGAAYRKSNDQLRQRFPFRTWERNSGEFCGSVISQGGNPKVIFLTQSTHALPIRKVTVRARAKPEDNATEAAVQSLRECTGDSDGRPHLAVQVKMSQLVMSGCHGA